MFRRREEIRKQLLEVIEKFRQKGSISPEKALTSQELGLPPRFEEAMHRRLGQTGIFVEVNGRYYMSEERLKQLQEQRQKAQGNGGGRGLWRMRQSLMVLRVARLVTTFLFVALLSANVFIQSWMIRWLTGGMLVVWVALFISHFYYGSKVRKRFSSSVPVSN